MCKTVVLHRKINLTRVHLKQIAYVSEQNSIQGLEPDNGQGGNNMNSGLGNSFYSRSGRQAARGTVVPGMTTFFAVA